jgi:Ca2+-binding RTX toxin-like protein
MVNIVSSFSGGVISGTSAGDIIVAVQPSDGASRTVDARGGNDVVLAGSQPVLSRSGPGGDSIATAFEIGADPAIWSTRANPLFGNPAVPHTSVLAAGFGAAHVYRVTVGAGETLSVDVDFAEGTQGGGISFDAALQILDADESVVAEASGSPTSRGGEGSRGDPGNPGGPSTDPFAQIVNDTGQAQVYYIRVTREDGAGVPTGGIYMLNVSLTGQAAAAPVQGDDSVTGGEGFDALYTLDGNDTLDGGPDNDTLLGGAGDDLFLYRHGDGNDVIDGGPGTDILRVLAENPGGDTVLPLGAMRVSGVETVDITGPGSVRILLTPGKAQGLAFDATTHTGGRVTLFFEMAGAASFDARTLDLTGFSDSADVLDVIGGDGAEAITGNAMANYIDGGAGDDTLAGGAGNDRIVTGSGTDAADGGAGNDTLDFTETADDVFADLAAGTARTASSQATLTGFEAVESGAGDDRLTGDRGSNLLRAHAGDDALYGDGVKLALLPGLSGQVYRLYQATLDRAPDAGGAQGWVAQLAEDRITLAEAAGSFVASREFQNTYGALDDAGFVELLYQNVLGRASDAAGRQGWLDSLANGASRADVVLGFSESREFINTTRAPANAWIQGHTDSIWADDVYRLYKATLDRAPDLGGFLDWTGRLGSGTPYLTAIEGFTGSAEFRTTYGALGDADFVDLLYNNVLDRDADAAGLQSWLDRLDAGATRAQVVEGFAQSRELVNTSARPLLDWVQAQGVDDALSGGAGTNTLMGGLLSDIFVFEQADAGTHEVLDLEAWDLVDFNGFGYATPAEAQSHMTQDGTDVVFTDQGTTVIFAQTALSDFTDGMFI